MKREISWRRIGIGLWLVLLAVATMLALSPVGTRLTRLAMGGTVATLIVGALVLSWKWRPAFYTFAGIILGSAVFLMLPGGQITSGSLRSEYIRALSSHKDCPYVWGGESQRGIDCSGLPRRSLQDALLREGLLTLNPAMIRSALDLWWNDTTAKNIGDGYAGRTRMVTQCRSLNEWIIHPSNRETWR